jgi:hypothetical protein
MGAIGFFISVFIIWNPVGKCKNFVTEFQKNEGMIKKRVRIHGMWFRILINEVQ